MRNPSKLGDLGEKTLQETLISLPQPELQKKTQSHKVSGQKSFSEYCIMLVHFGHIAMWNASLQQQARPRHNRTNITINYQLSTIIITINYHHHHYHHPRHHHHHHHC